MNSKLIWDDINNCDMPLKKPYQYTDIGTEACKTQAEREADYGPADRNHENIAKIWNVQLFKKLKEPLTKEEVALLFIGAKLAREANEHKRDNLVDAVAYLGILDGFHRGE